MKKKKNAFGERSSTSPEERESIVRGGKKKTIKEDQAGKEPLLCRS